MNRLISKSEKEYISQGCVDNIRADGRSSSDFRSISILSEIFPHTSGSSRFKSIGTDILCAVKIEVSEPSIESSNDGTLDVDIDLSCFSGVDDRRLSEIESRLSEQMQRYVYFCSILLLQLEYNLIISLLL